MSVLFLTSALVSCQFCPGLCVSFMSALPLTSAVVSCQFCPGLCVSFMPVLSLASAVVPCKVCPDLCHHGHPTPRTHLTHSPHSPNHFRSYGFITMPSPASSPPPPHRLLTAATTIGKSVTPSCSLSRSLLLRRRLVRIQGYACVRFGLDADWV